MCGSCSRPRPAAAPGRRVSSAASRPRAPTSSSSSVTCTNPAVTPRLSGIRRLRAPTHELCSRLATFPTAAVQPFTKGVTGDNCGAATSFSPLVRRSAREPDGSSCSRTCPVGKPTSRWSSSSVGGRRASDDRQRAQLASTPQQPRSRARSPGCPKQKARGDIPPSAFGTASDALEVRVSAKNRPSSTRSSLVAVGHRRIHPL